VRWSEAVATPGFVEFWTPRRVCLLSTVRPDGRPHAVAVGATLDVSTGIARVIASGSSVKVRNVRAGGVHASISQLDGGHWCTLQGRAEVRDDPPSVADAERRYAERYRIPRPNPHRVVIELTVDSVLGRF
jgi:F420H(2)-dependent biliverdin reductase